MERFSSCSTTHSNQPASVLSPLHQRILDFESRIRKWSLSRSVSRRSSSNAPPTGGHNNSVVVSARDSSTNNSSNLTDNKTVTGLESAVFICPPSSHSNFQYSNGKPTAVDFYHRPSGCRTTPVRRRIMMNLPVVPGEVPLRTRPEWRHPVEGLQSPSNRASDSAEVQRRYEEIKARSGRLIIEGCEYTATLDDMERIHELGSGTCGHVYKMRYKPTGHVFAVKHMARTSSKEENKRVIMDLDVVLRSHDCPHIVRCFGCFITEHDVHVVMELMATCLDKLAKRIKGPIPEPILGKMTVPIVKALDYLKDKQHVMHRDVKPSNVLLDWNGTVKLCDFGISGRLVDSKAKTRAAGCAAYMAHYYLQPERIEPPNPQQPNYDVRADVWSLGITLVELATGRFPYQGCNFEIEVLAKILQEQAPRVTTEQGFSLEFCDFVSLCLQKDVNTRPKYKQLMEHPFIKYYETADIDVASWFSDAMMTPPTPDANSNFKV